MVRNLVFQLGSCYQWSSLEVRAKRTIEGLFLDEEGLECILASNFQWPLSACAVTSVHCLHVLSIFPVKGDVRPQMHRVCG